MIQQIIQFVRDFDRLNIPRNASQIAFNALFALIPMIALSLQILLWVSSGTLDADRTIHWILQSGLPEGMEQWVNDLEGWINALRQLSVTGLIISALSSLFLVIRLNEALSEIWEVPVRQIRFVVLWLTALSIPIVLSVLFSLITLAATFLYLPNMLGDWISWVGHTVDISGWVSLLFTWLLLVILYRLVPGVPVNGFKLSSMSLLTALVMFMSGQLFIQLLGLLPSMQLMTGVISSLPLLLVWVFWLSIVFQTGSLLLKYWHSGPLKPLHILTWDQLIRIIIAMHQHQSVSWKFARANGLNHANYNAALNELERMGWVTGIGKDQFQLTKQAYDRPFDEIWPLFSYEMPTEGDALHRLFGKIAKLPLRKVLDLMMGSQELP